MWVTITLEQEVNNLIHVCIICIQLCINRPVLNYQNLSIPLRLRGVPYNNNNNNNTVFRFEKSENNISNIDNRQLA